ncbi:retrovirus-related pol polyprotein from transposon TNT 1-94 [Tanacetum coccineum]
MSLSLNELIENLKVYEMIITKDSEIVKAKVERKSLALKARKESSDEEFTNFGSVERRKRGRHGRYSKEAEMTKTVKVIENALDAATRIILLENVQSHRKIRTKKLLSEVLGVIAVKKMTRRYNNESVVAQASSEITKDGKVIGRGIRKKGLYVIKLGNRPKDKICLATIDENSTLWHRRLGHANMRLIQSLASKELVRNLPKLKFDQHFCDACKIGKQAHAIHKAKNIVSMTTYLELLHTVHPPYGVTEETFTPWTDHGREFDNEVQFGEFVMPMVLHITSRLHALHNQMGW